MKITARVRLFGRGELGTTQWIPIGFFKTGEREWDVVAETGETIGRCWGPPDARQFCFGSDGNRGFHMERLPDAKAWDVEIAERPRAPANVVDFPLAPPDEEAQPRTQADREYARRKARVGMNWHDARAYREKQKAERLRAFAEAIEKGRAEE